MRMPSSLAVFTRRFFDAYARGDLDAAASCLAHDVVASVTNASGRGEAVRGRDEYIRRVPDLHAVGGSLEVTQLLEIDDETTLTMVEIRAHRSDKDLHNFAAFLARVHGDLITHLWMVDAKPAYSEEFWS